MIITLDSPTNDISPKSDHMKKQENQDKENYKHIQVLIGNITRKLQKQKPFTYYVHASDSDHYRQYANLNNFNCVAFLKYFCCNDFF